MAAADSRTRPNAATCLQWAWRTQHAPVVLLENTTTPSRASTRAWARPGRGGHSPRPAEPAGLRHLAQQPQHLVALAPKERTDHGDRTPIGRARAAARSRHDLGALLDLVCVTPCGASVQRFLTSDAATATSACGPRARRRAGLRGEADPTDPGRVVAIRPGSRAVSRALLVAEQSLCDVSVARCRWRGRCQ
jgi:hypothetical protein